jgi:hypothetical protein
VGSDAGSGLLPCLMLAFLTQCSGGLRPKIASLKGLDYT